MLLPGARLEADDAQAFEHPVRAARIEWQGENAGRLFEFHPSFVEGRAGVLYVNLRLMLERGKSETKYEPIRRFPTSAFDISIVVESRLPSGRIHDRLKELAGGLLTQIRFLRVYEGDPLPKGMKSLSYRLVLGADDRTLSNEEMAEVRSRVIEGLEKDGVELRL
jgi:phenylalanyl-tRNA synthetase beta chain